MNYQDTQLPFTKLHSDCFHPSSSGNQKLTMSRATCHLHWVGVFLFLPICLLLGLVLEGVFFGKTGRNGGGGGWGTRGISGVCALVGWCSKQRMLFGDGSPLTEIMELLELSDGLCEDRSVVE